MARGAARDLQKEAAWRRRLGRQAESGQSVRGWCRQHGVTETTFYWWRRELARRDMERKPSARWDAERKPSARRNAGRPAASFVLVHVTETAVRNGDSQIEIVLTDGRRVRVTGPVNQQMLTAVLEALALADAVAGERRAC